MEIQAEASRQETSAFADARAHFSGRRLEVFDQLLRRESEKFIARNMNLSPHTVHGHIKVIYAVLGVHSRKQLLQLVLGNDRLPVLRSIPEFRSLPLTAPSKNVDERQRK